MEAITCPLDINMSYKIENRQEINKRCRLDGGIYSNYHGHEKN
jgi:hypothetical protein